MSFYVTAACPHLYTECKVERAFGRIFLFWQYIMLPCHPNEPEVNTACSMGQGVVPK